MRRHVHAPLRVGSAHSFRPLSKFRCRRGRPGRRATRVTRSACHERAQCEGAPTDRLVPVVRLDPLQRAEPRSASCVLPRELRPAASPARVRAGRAASIRRAVLEVDASSLVHDSTLARPAVTESRRLSVPSNVDSSRRARSPAAGAQPEQRLVERTHELDAVAVHERLDERAADRVARRRRRRAPPASAAQASSSARSGAPRRAAPPRGTRRPSPSPPPSSAASASRSCPDRNGSSANSESSQRSSASAELAVVVGEREPLAQVARQPAAERVEPGRLAVRLRRRDRQQRPDPQRPEVEPLEDDRPGGDRAAVASRSARDRVGKLGRRVRRLARPRPSAARELEHAERSTSRPNSGRHQPAAPRARASELPGRGRAHADAAAELDLRRPPRGR